MSLIVSVNGTAVWRNASCRCAIGRSGVRAHKREGDGATPEGIFPLLEVLYRKDRLALPNTRLRASALAPEDGWCDDPLHPAYNMKVKLPHAAGCEALWRDDGLYDLMAITGHNADPVVPGAGSAIFVHVAGVGYPPTEGCVAFALPDLQRILSDWLSTDRLVVQAAR